MGSKNHEVVPTVLIVQISGLRSGGVNKIIGSLAKRNLVAKVQNSKCKQWPFNEPLIWLQREDRRRVQVNIWGL
jgi:RIO-like serine/threonine protein kinase